MDSITLLELRTAVINEASIDGQTGASGRHPTATLNALINRYCRAARAIAADESQTWGQKLGAITALPAATSGEDFIEVPFPTDAIEVIAVDVTADSVPIQWAELDEADWTQRRTLNLYLNSPEGGVGWWAVKDPPEARGSGSITAGTLALFPSTLTGSYRVTYREQFTAMSDDTHLFVGIEPMFTYVINSCVCAVTKRDNNKRPIYAQARDEADRAEKRLRRSAKRMQTGGALTPTRVGGELF